MPCVQDLAIWGIEMERPYLIFWYPLSPTESQMRYVVKYLESQIALDCCDLATKLILSCVRKVR